MTTPSTPPSASIIPRDQRGSAVHTALLGFAADPFLRWFWPQADAYVKAVEIIDTFAGDSVSLDCAWGTTDLNGVALWLPPGYTLDEEKVLGMFAQTMTPQRFESVLQVLGAIDEYHPKTPCWYLNMIAVDPAHQGQGLGSALMKAALARCDEDGIPAYLESSNPRNISLYLRHGFEPMGEIQMADSPVITPMLRPIGG
ncbi:MAG: GNAT family N-acetyltransferase [Pseudomonadales bacterium]